MYKQQFNKRSKIVFTHFSRRGYALFSVLGREVLVGVLAVSTLTYAKADSISTDTASAIDSLSRTEQKLDEVVVTGSRVPLTLAESAQIVAVVTRDDIQRAAAASINDVLKLATGVDVRQRGGFGVQTDISLRGGNFDQVTILLNGVSISSPHTGHLSADFPVSVDDIERIEVLEGANVHSLCGVINIVTRHSKQTGANIHAFGGSYGYVGSNANGTLQTTSTHHFASAGYTRSDGATPNSAFQSAKAFYKGDFSVNNIDIYTQAAYSHKPFEANTFYGASSTDQWEMNERWLGSLNLSAPLSADANASRLQSSIFWNHWNDHYQWHRNNPAGENFHKVDTYGGNIDYLVSSVLGKTAVGAELRNEAIHSTKLGELVSETDRYNHEESRLVLTAFLEHNILFSKLTISPSINYINYWCNKSGGKGGRLLPALSLSYRPATGVRLYASWSTGLRLPTFTDLYYSGQNIEGNRNLKPEQSSDIQLGVHYSTYGFQLQTQLFYSHKYNMIDWVVFDNENENNNIFHSVNFRQDSWGAEINAALMLQELVGKQFPVRKFSIKYSYINQDSDYGMAIRQSKYAMEYLRHKLTLGCDGNIIGHLNYTLTWTWKDRIGESNNPYSLFDARLSWDATRWSVYCEGNNLLNTTYYDYISIPQPGFTFKAGIKIRL